MIFPVPELIARLSAVCPLLPGDLIFTGTPAGVGGGRTPPVFLHPGDILVSWIDGVGELRNPMVPHPLTWPSPSQGRHLPPPGRGPRRSRTGRTTSCRCTVSPRS